MSQAILISIRPKWCELIASGEKTVEVRKNRPKIDTPFKCYIYETRGFERVGNDNLNCRIGGNGRGKVIGEFTCEDIYRVDVPFPAYQADMSEMDTLVLKDACLSYTEAHDYLGHRSGYGWHITDLKLYAEPREINEFKRWNRTEQTAPCAHVYALYSPCESCTECNLKRAPQSWCYIEELE